MEFTHRGTRFSKDELGRIASQAGKCQKRKKVTGGFNIPPLPEEPHGYGIAPTNKAVS
jgi:hypothetical protein